MLLFLLCDLETSFTHTHIPPLFSSKGNYWQQMTLGEGIYLIPLVTVPVSVSQGWILAQFSLPAHRERLFPGEAVLAACLLEPCVVKEPGSWMLTVCCEVTLWSTNMLLAVFCLKNYTNKNHVFIFYFLYLFLLSCSCGICLMMERKLSLRLHSWVFLYSKDEEIRFGKSSQLSRRIYADFLLCLILIHPLVDN